jgi:uncharacterized membrane protein
MNWALYAVLSAVFGALVAIFGKIGVRDVDSNLAVALRTVIIVCFAYEMDEMGQDEMGQPAPVPVRFC